MNVLSGTNKRAGAEEQAMAAPKRRNSMCDGMGAHKSIAEAGEVGCMDGDGPAKVSKGQAPSQMAK